MNKVLIAGGTGLVGSYLIKGLIDKGYTPVVLTRNARIKRGYTTFAWDPSRAYIDKESFKGLNIIINLSGANIGESRWTISRKKEILESRIKSTSLLYNTAKELNTTPVKYISASATGFYGAITGDRIFTEDDEPADDFLGDICSSWENEADRFKNLASKVIKLRLGIVLDKNDGALKRMLLPAKLYIGSAIGTGRQYIPWIHPEDLTNIFIKAIEDDNMDGSYNAVSPSYVTNKEFLKTLTTVLKKPFLGLNTPSSVLIMLFGEMANIVLEGSRVSPKKIMDAGYKFKYPELKEAITNILKD